MRKHLFNFTALIMIVGLLCLFSVSLYVTHSNNVKAAKDTVIETTKICAGLYSADSDPSRFVKAAEDTRITIIAPDGTVLADSRPLDVSAMENHLNRPEIAAAQQNKPQTFIRHSDSLGVDFMYYALKVDQGNSYVYVRVALPIGRIDSYLRQSLPLLVIVILIILLLSYLFSRMMINRITGSFESIATSLRDLTDGQYTGGQISGGYQEIAKITASIDELAGVLQDSMRELVREKNKLVYILNNIGDGLLVVDQDRNIVLINTVALDIFNSTMEVEGKNLNYLVYDQTLSEAVESSITQGKSILYEQSYSGRIFFIVVKRLPDTPLIMIALTDITEAQANAKQREEFFANASHELKTPLTAIKGFNELTQLNNKDKKLDKYIAGISEQSQRMLSLLGDMLKLSELENTQTLAPSALSLAAIVQEVRETLTVSITEQAIELDVRGEAIVTAEKEHLYEVVKNLLENAIRYNEKGGKVNVLLVDDEQSTFMSVSDDGIGISPEEQTRIFERFYRVEKSRSPRNGGTGLGLSIIKHVCALYDWKISLKSKLGIGTEVTIIFKDQDKR